MEKAIAFFMFGLLALSAINVQALPSPANAESIEATEEGLYKARRSSGQPMTVLDAVYALTNAYGVPLSYERSFVGEDRSTLEYKSIEYTLEEGETLREALDKLCAASGGRFVWKRIRGVLSVIPSGLGGKIESTLDETVSIHLDNVSTWDALLALAKAVNNRETTDRVLRLFLGAHEYPNYPLSLRTNKTLSIHVDNVSAREALCAIIAESPFEIRFSYQNHYRPDRSPSARPSSSLSLRFYENGELYKRYSERFREELIEMDRDVQMTLPIDRRR